MAQSDTAAGRAHDVDLAASLSIDRLVLHVPQMSEADARVLAEQVGEALRDWPTAPTASGRIARLHTRVAAPQAASAGAAMGAGGSLGGGAGSDTDTGALARRIAEAVLASALREVR